MLDMRQFVGRQRDMQELSALLERVRRSGSGKMIAIRGRRRVGKSRLLTEWLRRQDVPYVYFEAGQDPEARELELFKRAVVGSTLPTAAKIQINDARSWADALAALATGSDQARPTVVVIDEFPNLLVANPALAARLQVVFDTTIDDSKPVVVVLIGSDLSMMERLSSYAAPLYGRIREFVLGPLNPHDIYQYTGASAASTFDAYLLTGGFPELVETWEEADTVETYVRREVRRLSPFVVAGERIVSQEFPSETSAKTVLACIAQGSSSFTSILSTAGLTQPTLTRSLKTLIEDKRVVEASAPMSVPRDLRRRLYRVQDPYLAFWLRFIMSSSALIDIELEPIVTSAILRDWTTYRGAAIEPVIRQAITRLMLSDSRFGAATACGSWWSRDQNTEIDLVGVDRNESPRSVEFVGSIKWRERQPFDNHDRSELLKALAVVPGVTNAARLVAVSRSGFSCVDEVDIQLTPEELLAAFA
ncbi:MAG: ATP-binding protein, partial [Candidatus Dormibacteraceae bacterium]